MSKSTHKSLGNPGLIPTESTRRYKNESGHLESAGDTIVF